MTGSQRDEEIEMARLLDENDIKDEELHADKSDHEQEPEDGRLEEEIDSLIAEDERTRRSARYRSSTWLSKLDFSSNLTMTNGRYVILGVNFLVSLGIALSSTTALDMQKKLVCTNWYAIYAPDSDIPLDEKDPLCQVPEVQTWFSGLLVYMSLFDAFGGT
jgi:hypothetical protein